MNDYREQHATLSVIIPAYNAERFIRDAISSALSQIPKPDEIIVIDDGSKDKTASIVETFPSVVLVRQQNQGVSSARNNGLAMATGKYISFLDSDDVLLPGALAAGVETLEANPLAVMAYGGAEVINEHGDYLRSMDSPERVISPRDIFLGANPVPSQTVLRHAAIAALGGFNTSLDYSEDQELWIRLAANGGAIICHGKRVVSYRRHSMQASRNSLALYRSWFVIIDQQSRVLAPDLIDRKSWQEIRKYMKKAVGRYMPFYMAHALRRGGLKDFIGATALYISSAPQSLLGTLDMVKSKAARLGPAKA